MLSDMYDANNHPYISSMINASSAFEINHIQKKDKIILPPEKTLRDSFSLPTTSSQPVI